MAGAYLALSMFLFEVTGFLVGKRGCCYLRKSQSNAIRSGGRGLELNDERICMKIIKARSCFFGVWLA